MRIFRWLPFASLTAACTAPIGASDASMDAIAVDSESADRVRFVDSALDSFETIESPDALVDAPIQTDAPDAGDRSNACAQGTATAFIGTCIDAGMSPRACLTQARAMLGSELCDSDGDGLADDLEDALGRSYAMAFVYNRGDGGHTGGDAEPYWPANFGHYVNNAHLIWRVDNDSGTAVDVFANPTLAMLAGASVTVGGNVRRAADPRDGHGANFWLCLDQPGGNYPPSALVTSLDASRNLPGGIDVAVIVRPTDGDATGRYAMVANMVFYAYNAHTTIDNHEGDWEGGAVIVDLDSGSVTAVFYDRHNSADNLRLLPLRGAGAQRVIDPRSETTFGNVCSESDAAAARGVRFWDFGGARHHVVSYISTGGHSSYAYPGNTKLTGIGCFESSIVRDTHNGDGARLLPWLERYVDDWSGTNARAVTAGVHFINVGEPTRARVPWAAYRGQWGCQHQTVAKSFPGPWDNARHCRFWPTHSWGSAPPFVTVDTAATCVGTP